MVLSVSRKPTLALMGEFSAGKSTLSNLLLGSNPLPTRVTATRLAPVRVTFGQGPAQCLDFDGAARDLPDGGLEKVNPETTRCIRLELEADILELCDLIDFPGISDPNMPREACHRMLEDVDHVVWCTHATQAWRQSEAAAWDAVRNQTSGRNLLLITQIDKLTSERDRARVMARVRSETEDLFEGHYAISLLDALDAGGDESKWQSSGAAAFTEHLIELLLDPVLADPPLPAGPGNDAAVSGHGIEDASVLPRRVRNKPGDRLRTRPLPSGSGTGVVRQVLRGGDRP